MDIVYNNCIKNICIIITTSKGAVNILEKGYINNLLWWPHEAHEPFELFHWKSPTKLLPHKGPGRALLDDSKDWNCLTLD